MPLPPCRAIVTAAFLAFTGPLTSAGSALAQSELAFTRYANSPLNVSAAACPPGDPDRMFVLTRSGGIRIVNLATGQFVPGFFATVPSDGASNGVTGLAFHPNYATNGYVYVSRGQSVARIQAAGDPTTATTSSGAIVTIIRIPALAFGGQHVGGWIGFGPDGKLYYSTGDVGNSGNGQRTDHLLSKIIRIDVDGPDGIPGTADDDGFPADENKNYTIPSDNPFVGAPGEDEIWAYGLRNPYRCSFDQHTGDLWIGDVGEALREEIDFQPAHVAGRLPGMAGYVGGRNYGWATFEGERCYRSTTACAALTTATAPIASYPLGGGGAPYPPFNIPVGSAILGGYVYHGCTLPQLRDWYIFGDAGSISGQPDFIWALRQVNGTAVAARQLVTTAPTAIFGFAQDLNGEIYLCGQGGFYKIGPASPGPDMNNNGELDSCEGWCGADFNRDGFLDADDLSDYVRAYFSIPPEAGADFDNSGTVDPDDLSTYVTVYFGCQG